MLSSLPPREREIVDILYERGASTVIEIGEDRRQRQIGHIPGDRRGRLIGVDHHHRPSRRDEPEDRRGVGDAVAHDDADGLVTLHARLRQGGRDPLDEVGYLVARIPLSGELDERPITVGLQTGGQVVGEVHGHAGLELGGT